MKQLLLAILLPFLSGCSGHWIHPENNSTQMQIDYQRCNEHSYQAIPVRDVFYYADLDNFRPRTLDEEDEIFTQRMWFVSECMEKLGYQWLNNY